MSLELLTASRLRTFRDCARLHHYMYNEGWRPTRTAEALRFGSLVHVALEAYWKAIMRWQAGSSEPTRACYDDAMNAIAKYPDSDEFERIRAEELLFRYVSQWSSDHLLYEVLGVEAEFRAPLLNPETRGASKTWQLAGKVDVIVRRKEDGRVLVVEHKTCGEDIRGDDATYWSRLSIDPQISGYIIGAEMLGFTADEILYDVLVKPGQRPKKATPIEDRKFTKDGVLYKTQRATDETPDEYRERLREAMDEDPTRWCVRKSIPRSASQIEDFLFDAWQQSAVMRDSARLGRAPRNADACHRFGTCPMWTLCSTGADPAKLPADYVRLTNKHPELSQEDPK